MVFNPATLIPIGASLLSGLFGKGSSEKQNQNSSTNTNQSETQIAGSVQVGSQSSSNVSNQVSQNNQTSTSNQASTTNQNGQTITDQLSNQISEQTGSQVGSVNRLDQATQDMLTSRVQEMLGQSGGTEALQGLIGELSAGGNDFDVDQFVSGVMQGAEATTRSNLESGIGRIQQETGVNRNSNSAAALLAGRLENDAVANLASTRANATATGEGLRQQGEANRSSALVGATGAMNDQMIGLIGSLLGASEQATTQTQQTGSQQQTTTGSEQTSQQSGTTTTNQQSQQQTGQTTTTDSGTVVDQQASGTVQQGNLTQNSKTSSSGSGSTNKGGGLGGLLEALTGMFGSSFEGT